MKCLACDVILSDREATRKSSVTEEYIELCDYCFRYIKNDVTWENSESYSSTDFDTIDDPLDSLEVFTDDLFIEKDE